MSLNKAIAHGKEKRDPVISPDSRCRNNGGCYICLSDRMYSTRKRELIAKEKLKEAEAEMKELLNEKTPVTGRTDLDIIKEIVSAMKPGILTVVGGRPGEGKTKFACCLADIISHLGKKSALFALGESREILIKRFKPDDEMLEHNLFIDDSCHLTVSLMEQRIQALGGVDCVIIDYLGLISPDTKVPKRSEEVAQITAGLKALAVEYDIPVVCFAQLSIDTEGNPVFRESKAIVTDSDNVITLGRMWQKTAIF